MCSHPTLSIEESDFLENIAGLGLSWPSYSMGLLSYMQISHKTLGQGRKTKMCEESLSG